MSRAVINERLCCYGFSFIPEWVAFWLKSECVVIWVRLMSKVMQISVWNAPLYNVGECVWEKSLKQVQFFLHMIAKSLKYSLTVVLCLEISNEYFCVFTCEYFWIFISNTDEIAVLQNSAKQLIQFLLQVFLTSSSLWQRKKVTNYYLTSRLNSTTNLFIFRIGCPNLVFTSL